MIADRSEFMIERRLEVEITTDFDLTKAAAAADPIERLRALDPLKRDGLITEVEFEIKRQELMSRQ